MGEIVWARFMLGEVATSMAAIRPTFREIEREQPVLSTMINNAEKEMWKWAAGETLSPGSLEALHNDVEKMFKRLLTLFSEKCRAGAYRGPRFEERLPPSEERFEI
jgi:hypothetical protein